MISFNNLRRNTNILQDCSSLHHGGSGGEVEVVRAILDWGSASSSDGRVESGHMCLLSGGNGLQVGDISGCKTRGLEVCVREHGKALSIEVCFQILCCQCTKVQLVTSS